MTKRIRRVAGALLALALLIIPAWGTGYDYGGQMEGFFEESGAGELCGATIAVTARPEVRVRRIMAREGISEEYARRRVAAQKPEAWFEEHCTYTLRNDGTQAELEAGARRLLTQMINKEDI